MDLIKCKKTKTKKNKQLDLIKDQKNKQPDPAGEIKFTDERLTKLRTKLRKFGTKIMNGTLSLKEAKKD